MSGSFRITSRARGSGCYRDLAGKVLFSGDAPGIFGPFAVSFRARVTASLIVRRLAPTCRFSDFSTASFIVRVTHPMRVTLWIVGRGSWGLAPRADRTVRSGGPAIAFVHRADRLHRSQLPWVFVPLSGLDRRSPVSTSGAFPPMGLACGATTFLQRTSRRPPAPFGVLGDRRLVVPAVFPFGPAPRLRFLRRPRTVFRFSSVG